MTNETTAITPTTRVTLTISGMTCGACERHVGQALASVPAVAEVAVNRLDGLAQVQVTGVPAVSALIEAVRAAGYDAGLASTEMPAPGPASKKQAGPGCGCCEVRA